METQGIGVNSQVLIEASNTLKVIHNFLVATLQLYLFLNHSLFFSTAILPTQIYIECEQNGLFGS